MGAGHSEGKRQAMRVTPTKASALAPAMATGTPRASATKPVGSWPSSSPHVSS